MLSKTQNEQPEYKLVRWLLYYIDRKEHLNLDISDFNKFKGNNPVEMLHSIYAFHSAVVDLPKWIGGFLDMFTSQARFMITQELLVNMYASGRFATLLICYFSDKLGQLFQIGKTD